MKSKLFLLFFISFALISCASTDIKSSTNYNLDTYEPLVYSTDEVLGKVTVHSFMPSYCDPAKDKMYADNLYNALEKKALKKYGNNIALRDITISGKDTLVNTALWTTPAALFLAAGFSMPSSVNGSKDYTFDDLPTGNKIMIGTWFCSLFAYFFQSTKATAVVVKNKESYSYAPSHFYGTENDFYNLKIAKKQVDSTKKQVKDTEKQVKDTEKVVNDRQKIKDNAKQNGYPILLAKRNLILNSVGGVSISISFSNTSEKKMKYVFFSVIPYNRVNDVAYSEIGNKSLARCKVTDFIEPDNNYTGYWECVWYNSTISYFEIEEIEITFEDNTKEIISDSEIIKKMWF